MEANLLYNFREEQGPEQFSDPALKEKDEKSVQSLEAIRCKNCGWHITTKDQKIAVNDSHTHTFFNPAGIVFELVCFRKASGCMLAGEATSEFTWFSGYVWRYALCQNCTQHLGWYYEDRDSSFFGLIFNNLVQ